MRIRLFALTLSVLALATLAAETGLNSAFSSADANAWTARFLKTEALLVGKVDQEGDQAALNPDGSRIMREFSQGFGNVTEVQYVYARCDLDDRGIRALQKRSLNTLQLRYPELFQNTAITWRLIEQSHCQNERMRKNFFHGFIAIGANARSRAKLLAALHKSGSEWQARPWKNNVEKVEYMMQISAEFGGQGMASNKDRCVERILKAGNLGQAPSVSELREGEECAQALAGCGNCHLPRVNNCNYTVEYWDGPAKKSFNGNVTTEDKSTITMQGEMSTATIQKQDIVKTVWQNGADPIETWWNFKAFSSRGDIAHKMLALSASNNVKCTHCHEGHGDFRLTNQGQDFLKSGKINP